MALEGAGSRGTAWLARQYVVPDVEHGLRSSHLKAALDRPFPVGAAQGMSADQVEPAQCLAQAGQAFGQNLTPHDHVKATP